jgi:hypothetical protein
MPSRGCCSCPPRNRCRPPGSAGRPSRSNSEHCCAAAMAHAAQVSRQALVAMYELASSSAVSRGNPIERYFRDVMAALQHANQ